MSPKKKWIRRPLEVEVLEILADTTDEEIKAFVGASPQLVEIPDRHLFLENVDGRPMLDLLEGVFIIKDENAENYLDVVDAEVFHKLYKEWL